MCLIKALTSGAETRRGAAAALFPRLGPQSESVGVLLLLTSRLWELDVDVLEEACLLLGWEVLLAVGGRFVTRESFLASKRRGFGIVA